MRIFTRLSATTLLALTLSLVMAQREDSAGHQPERPRHFDAEDLHEDAIELPGQGKVINGIDLSSMGRPRMAFSDDSTYAEREFQDSAWVQLRSASDSVTPGVNTWWVRYHLNPDKDLTDVPVILSLGSTAEAEVFLNGDPILRTGPMPLLSGHKDMPRSDSLPYVSIPFTFRCDGRPEVIAVRLSGPANATIESLGCDLVIHRPDTVYGTHRVTLHFGVFVGVNIIILVLSIVLWFQDRRETSWLFLALLAIIEAVDSVIDLSGEMGFLGFSDGVSEKLELMSIVLVPWPLYLLIMVLRKLRGDLDRRSAKWYTRSVLFVSGVCASIAIISSLAPGGIPSSFTDDQVISSPLAIVVLVLAILCALLFTVVLTWFAIAVVRLAIQLLRTKGYERWVGGGALASSVLTILLKIPGGIGTGMSSWTSVAALYCDHVAVPLSVAIYLAIRSAHHSKAVARQRDDLDREVHERTAELREAKKRSDDLLLNILPHEVAEELKQTGSAAARHFDQATVMFTDFKGFTAMSERVAPGELLQELNTCFRAFDDIIARHGVEKIKTIGDSYMCAGGLPDPGLSTPASVVLAALEMQDFMHDRQQMREAAGQLAFIMRVGIHTGPVVAGIVGVKKFQYDIWGDTVNTASRMESSGEAGRVNISDATYALVRNETGLTFTARGKVSAKGKGEMEMFFVRRSEVVA